MDTDYLTSLKYLGLFSRIKRLSDSTLISGRKIYDNINIDIEPNWFLIFKIIQEKKQTSISEISTILKFSHPSVITTVKKMDKAGYLNIIAHSSDKRKQVISFSKKAEKKLPEMQDIWNASEKAVASIFSDDTFINELDKLEKALEKKNFFDRLQDNLNNK